MSTAGTTERNPLSPSNITVITEKPAPTVAELSRDFRMVRGVETGVLRIKKLLPRAVVPSYGSASAAGLDLTTTESFVLHPDQWHAFSTDIAVELPRGTYGRVAPRSGLAFKHGIDVLAGVIDEDYRGEIKVILINHGTRSITVEAGDRVAQLIVEKYVPCLPLLVDDLSDSVRGDGKFGSTGT